MGKTTKKQHKVENLSREQEWNSYNRGEIKFLPYEAMNDKQDLLYKACLSEDMVIAYGDAGTSKSYTIAAASLSLIADKNLPYEEILVLRSPVPCGPSTGLKPGTGEEKMAEWSAPAISNFRKAGQTENNNDGFIKYLIGTKKLRAEETAAIKGSSWDNTIVILEEAQECSLEQWKNIVTRIGENSKLFINGDFSQANNKVRDKAMFKYITSIGYYNNYVMDLINKGLAVDEWQTVTPVIHFTKNDIVRSGICRLNIEIFEMIENNGIVEIDGEKVDFNKFDQAPLLSSMDSEDAMDVLNHYNKEGE